MTAPFDDVRLPEDIERGSEIGPSFRTSIITLVSGDEQRNADWSQERLMANISYGIMADENGVARPEGEVETAFRAIMNFYRARMGQLTAFRFRDWTDFSALSEHIGTGDGTNRGFQLSKFYSARYARRITRPVASTVVVTVNGVATTAFTLPAANPGRVLFNAAPASGAIIRASFQYDVPMRFDSDMMAVQFVWARAGRIPDINLIQHVE